MEYGNGAQNGQNTRAYRLAHIILWRAEIAVEEGELDYARQLVNQIRNRTKRSDVVMGRVANTKFGPGIEIIIVDWTKPAANYSIEPYPAGAEAFLL